MEVSFLAVRLSCYEMALQVCIHASEVCFLDMLEFTLHMAIYPALQWHQLTIQTVRFN